MGDMRDGGMARPGDTENGTCSLNLPSPVSRLPVYASPHLPVSVTFPLFPNLQL